MWLFRRLEWGKNRKRRSLASSCKSTFFIPEIEAYPLLGRLFEWQELPWQEILSYWRAAILSSPRRLTFGATASGSYPGLIVSWSTCLEPSRGNWSCRRSESPSRLLIGIDAQARSFLSPNCILFVQRRPLSAQFDGGAALSAWRSIGALCMFD